MNEKKQKNGIKVVILIVVLAILVSAAAIGTIAYLATKTNELKNTFTVGKVGCEVEETFDFSEKKNVFVTNTGDVDEYIRATFVITWQDQDGNVYGALPVAGTDYTIEMGSTKWEIGPDGYYYYNTKVAPENSTENLINSVKPLDNPAPQGYSLSVEILAQAIQADTASASQDAWGYTPGTGSGN